MMERRHFVQCGGLLLAVQLVGCAGEDGDGGESSTGGTNQGTGGDTTATGGTNQGTGGDTTATGGTGGSTGGTGGSTGGTDQGTGGDPSTGGDTSTGGDGNMEENACMGDLSGEFVDGHPHSYHISAADIAQDDDEEVELYLEIGHQHRFVLTPSDRASLRAGNTIEKLAEGGGGGNHTHTFELSCV